MVEETLVGSAALGCVRRGTLGLANSRHEISPLKLVLFCTEAPPAGRGLRREGNDRKGRVWRWRA